MTICRLVISCDEVRRSDVRGIGAAPGLFCDKADHAAQSVEDIEAGHALVCGVKVVPERKACTEEAFVVRIHAERGVVNAEIIDLPLGIKLFEVEIIGEIVVGGGNGVKDIVAGVDDFEIACHYLVEAADRNVPEVELCVFGNGRGALEAVLTQAAPESGGIAERINVIDEGIGIGTHLLCVFAGVFVGTDVHYLTDENGVGAGHILGKKIFNEGNRFGLGDVQATIVVGKEGGRIFRLCIAGGMEGGVDFGHNGHAVFEHILLILTVFCLGVISVGRGETLHVAFKTERRVAVDAVVVDVKVDLVHLEIRHVLRDLSHVIHRHPRSADVDKSRSYLVFGVVGRLTAGECAVCADALNDGYTAVKKTCVGRRANGDLRGGRLEDIAFTANGGGKRSVLLENDLVRAGCGRADP